MAKNIFVFILSLLLVTPSFSSKKETSKKPASTSSRKEASSKKNKKSSSKKARVSLDDLYKKAEETHSGTLLVTQDGKFVTEKSWESPLTFYYMQGITPSLVTLALGSVLDEGKLNLESTLVQWIPEWLDHRGAIRISQLLTHTSGFSDDPNSPWYKNSDTWTWMKSQQTKHEPGTTFDLSDTNNLLLGFAISQATEKSPEDLVKKKIFTPLRIQKWKWDKDKFGHINTAGGLRIRNYDVLKIGNLIAENGVWNKKKIISETWLEHLQKPSEKNPLYGLGWWLHEERGVKAFYAFGYQGQYIVVVPSKKIVAVRLRSPVPVEQNKPEYDWTDFPKDLLLAITR